MYKRLKHGLLAPKLVTDYMRDKMYKPFLQILLYAILMVIPIVINDYNYQGIDASYKNLIINEMKDEVINYQIVDFKLEKIDASAKAYDKSVITFINVHISTEDSKNAKMYSLNLMEEGFEFRVAGTAVFKYNYYDFEELQSLELNRLKSPNSSEWDKVFSVTNKVLKEFHRQNAILDGFGSLIRNYALLMIFGLLLSFTFLLKFKSLINYKVMYKLGLYYTAPFMLGVMLMNLFGIMLFLLIGVILSVIYTFIGSSQIVAKLLNSDRK